jgi:hypothetical protein
MALLVIRGVLLWVLIPLGFLAWVVALPWLHPRGISLGAFLGWIDINFVGVLERTVLRSLFRTPRQPWIFSTDIAAVTHRVGKRDLY